MAAAPGVAWAQGLAPVYGATVRPGDLRQQFARAYQTAPPASQPGWLFTPSIDVLLGWTDAAQGAYGGQRQSDFFTTISPALAIHGDTPRATVDLLIAPQLRQYLHTPSQNRASLDFNGSAHVTLVPQMLFVDLRGASSTYSQIGGYGLGDGTTLGRQDTVQSTVLSIAPYLQHRFGGYGVGEIGYTLAYNSLSGANRTLISPFLPPVSDQEILTRGWHVSFISGENLGRFQVAARAQHRSSSGTGSLDGAYRDSQTVTLRYAVTRTVHVSGTIGHQALHYGGVTPYQFDGLIWNVKLDLLPNPDSSISIGYGSQAGGDSVLLDASWAPTARIRLQANYSEEVTTGQEQLADLLTGTSVNGLGQSIDPQTGIPLLTGDNFLGASTTPARVRRFSAVATLLGERDTWSLTLLRSESRYITPISGTPIGTGATTTASSVGAAWQHSFSPALDGNLYLQYGQRESGAPTPVTQQTMSASLGLSYKFSKTLSGRAQYSYNGTIGGGTALLPAYRQNLITLGLHKSF